MKSAARAQERTDAGLIRADEARSHALHLTTATNSACRSLRASSSSREDKPRRGRTSRSNPAISWQWRLNVSRTKRLRKLRSTASREARFPTTTPRRAKHRPLGLACTRKRSLLELLREARTCLNASPPGKRARRGNASDCKPLAALGPAPVQDRSPTQRFHARAKAMGARPANLGRLVGALHVCFPNSSKKPAITRCPGHYCQLVQRPCG
jgi:hypothetical protein